MDFSNLITLISIIIGLIGIFLSIFQMTKKYYKPVNIYEQDRIDERLKKLEKQIEKGIMLQPYEFNGGPTKKFPHLLIEINPKNSYSEDIEYKKYKKKMTYYYLENGKKWVKTWYLK